MNMVCDFLRFNASYYFLDEFNSLFIKECLRLNLSERIRTGECFS